MENENLPYTHFVICPPNNFPHNNIAAARGNLEWLKQNIATLVWLVCSVPCDVTHTSDTCVIIQTEEPVKINRMKSLERKQIWPPSNMFVKGWDRFITVEPTMI
jgi:hypothetical protein